LDPASAPAQVGFFEGRALFSRKHARTVSIAAGLLGLAGLGIASQAQFDFDPLNLKNPETESVSTLLDLMADGRTNPYSITILAANLDKANDLAKKLNDLDVLEKTVTLSDYVPKNQDEKLEIVDSMAFFLAPSLSGAAGAATSTGVNERRQAVGALLLKLDRLSALKKQTATTIEAARLATALRRFRLEDAHLREFERRLTALLPNRIRDLKLSLNAQPVTLDDLPANIKARKVAADGRARIEVQPKKDLRDREALMRFVSAVRRIAPDAAGTPVVILEAGEAVVTAFVEAAGIALIAIVLLLMVLFRRGRDVGLVFAPLALASIMTVAASVLFDLPFNFANVIVLPLLFGLGVANGIHLVARERDEAGVDAAMTTSTPRAMVFSALTTIGSFASLALSNHPGTASMGILLAIAIICALIASLGVLPALMAWTDPLRAKKVGA
jgi:hopanoid biosynthesis associated RND transporter like protein HpnN